MKKFISMVMAAAMVVTMVPATAFAAATVESTTAKVVDTWEVTLDDKDAQIKDDARKKWVAPELQLTLSGVDAQATTKESIEFTLELDNAMVFDKTVWEAADVVGKVTRPNANNEKIGDVKVITAAIKGDKKIKLAIEEVNVNANFRDGDVISIELTGLEFAKDTYCVATVKATGDIKSEEVVFAAIVDKGIKVELDEDVVKVAPDESEAIENIVIKPAAGYDFQDVLTFNYKWDGTNWVVDNAAGTHAKVVLKPSKGFEFMDVEAPAVGVPYATNVDLAEDALTIYVTSREIGSKTSWTISGLEVFADTAKAGAECKVTVSATKVDKVAVAVATVVDQKVVMELVDPDEDVPVFYNGVDVDNYGLTVDDDHVSLEVKIYETFRGAWENHKNFTLSLPEGVYVVEADGVEAVDVNETFTTATGGGYDYDAALEGLFDGAYVRGDYAEFEFRKGTFNETHDKDDAQKAHEITFTLKLVAEPSFVGDVTLKLEGAALDTQEVVIAKFVAPYTVTAEQNDVIIDYRYTEVPTEIVVKEAEAGLWAEGTEFHFAMEDVATTNDLIVFEKDATITVDEASDMEIKKIDRTNGLSFEVKEVSDEEPAEITISGIELLMQRHIPAGPYALELDETRTTTIVNFLNEDLFAGVAPDEDKVNDIDFEDFVVHEAFVNVVTAGRDQSDSSFTTTVVVPVGETTIYAGETAITLDVPAYINANGYIMVPVRAVANALGIANDCVQWNQASKTVIIMYGERLITMTAGSSVIYVGGAPLPSTSSVEIVDGRAFLGLRDLANALGVKSIAWDPATKVGTLNPKA